MICFGWPPDLHVQRGFAWWESCGLCEVRGEDHGKALSPAHDASARQKWKDDTRTGCRSGCSWPRGYPSTVVLNSRESYLRGGTFRNAAETRLLHASITRWGACHGNRTPAPAPAPAPGKPCRPPGMAAADTGHEQRAAGQLIGLRTRTIESSRNNVKKMETKWKQNKTKSKISKTTF